MNAPREPELRHVAAITHGRTLVVAPDGPARGWLVGFHGYAHNAEIFLGLLRGVALPDGWLLASVQALHPFYGRNDEVVANWMTRQDRELAIADNIAYVDAVLDDLEGAHGVPDTLVFAGFSQGVAMAYRAAMKGRRTADAVIAAGGDVPPELSAAERPWPRVLIVTGRADDWYTPARMEREAQQLAADGADVRTHAFEGGHVWNADVCAQAGALLREVSALRS